MIYYRVKRNYDDYDLVDRKLLKKCRLKVLVKDELYTLKEIEKNDIPLETLEKIEIKRTRTFYFFGARFEDEDQLW